MKQLERQREEEQLERARVVNALTQRLEESQQQCAKLLQTGDRIWTACTQKSIFCFLICKSLFPLCCGSISLGSVQEMSQIQIKLQQAQSTKALSENMNTVLQVCPHSFLHLNGTTIRKRIIEMMLCLN